MATLKKGILGTPRGKIGSIMGYQRKGKGIIQSLPTVVNKEKRRYNLNRSAIETELGIQWDGLPSEVTSPWSTFNNTSLSDRDFFIQFNMSISDKEYNKNLDNLWMTVSPFLESKDLSGFYNPSDQFANLVVSDDFLFSGGLLPTSVIFQWFTTSGTIGGSLVQPWTGGNKVYQQDLSGIIGVNFFSIRAAFFRTSPTITTQGIFIDIVKVRT